MNGLILVDGGSSDKTGIGGILLFVSTSLSQEIQFIGLERNKICK